MLKRKSPAIIMLSLIVLFLLISECYGKKSINIGVIGPMKFKLGQEMWNGAVLAADKINASGKVRIGDEVMPIRLIRIDSNEFLNVTSPTNAIEMLFFRNQVDFVVGGFRSEAVLSMQEVAMDYKKIFISAGAASPELTLKVAQNYKRYKYYFRGGTFNNHDLGKACFLQLAYVADSLRAKLGLSTIKVAIAAERTGWVDDLIDAAEKNFPAMGLELAGVFRPSAMAMDLRSEIRAIVKTDAPIVMTWFSSTVGAAFVSQAVEEKLPAVMLGINGDALQSDFWKATNGKADYVMTLSSFAPGVEMSSLTKPFVDSYMERFGIVPSFTAGGTYTAIACTIVPAIEKTGSMDPDVLVAKIENSKYETPHGTYVYDRDALGRPTHEAKFGVNYVLPLAIQWQGGQIKAVWPKNYQEKPDAVPYTLKGAVDIQIPEWVIKKYKKTYNVSKK